MILGEVNLFIFALSMVLGITLYSVLFLFLLGIKLLRRTATNFGTEMWLVTEVLLGSLVVVISLTGASLILFDRTIAGRFFYIASIIGAVLIVWSIAGIVAPYKAALGLGKFTWVGIFVGNCVISISNVTSFFLRMPSLL